MDEDLETVNFLGVSILKEDEEELADKPILCALAEALAGLDEEEIAFAATLGACLTLGCIVIVREVRAKVSGATNGAAVELLEDETVKSFKQSSKASGTEIAGFFPALALKGLEGFEELVAGCAGAIVDVLFGAEAVLGVLTFCMAKEGVMCLDAVAVVVGLVLTDINIIPYIGSNAAGMGIHVMTLLSFLNYNAFIISLF